MSEKIERSPTRRGMLRVDTKRCQGCQACMVACSLLHEGQVIPSLARIHIVLDPFLGEHQIRYCHQCRKAPCAQSCPQGAILFDPEKGFWAVDRDLCTGCGLCVKACPFGVLILHPEKEKALICDTCNGDPQCVRSCPTEALVWQQVSRVETP